MANPEKIKILQNEERITVEQISPLSLAEFLSQEIWQQELFSKSKATDYSKIFASLRKQPLELQKRLLVMFYCIKVRNFPNGQELGKELAKINNIHWFRPNQEPELSVLEQLKRTYLERLNYPSESPIPLKIIRENWDAARDADRDTSRRMAWVATRQILGRYGSTVWDAALTAVGTAWDEARGASRPARAARDAAEGAIGGVNWKTAATVAKWYAARDTEWIVVKDLMPARGFSKGNPFEPLMEMYDLGCWPIGPVINKNRETELVVFIPPAASSKTV